MRPLDLLRVHHERIEAWILEQAGIEFAAAQALPAMLAQPEKGDVIEGTSGLRKLRHADARRGKGKLGGLRIIWYWWQAGGQFWLFTLYDKDEMSDLSAKEKAALKAMLEREMETRR